MQVRLTDDQVIVIVLLAGAALWALIAVINYWMINPFIIRLKKIYENYGKSFEWTAETSMQYAFSPEKILNHDDPPEAVECKKELIAFGRKSRPWLVLSAFIIAGLIFASLVVYMYLKDRYKF